MNLDTFGDASSLYRTRGEEVQLERPLFTGDVFRNVAIPETQEGGMALILAHPCSFRKPGGRLADKILVCSVQAIGREGNAAWKRGLLDRMPLPDLDGPGSWAAFFDDLGRAGVDDLLATERLACLSDFGINMLQQRLICHLTRAEIPTSTFNEAFSHTYDEAELLEDWTVAFVEAGESASDAVDEFETFIRSGEPRLQDLLRDPQQRFTVRRACRQQLRTLLDARRGVEGSH